MAKPPDVDLGSSLMHAPINSIRSVILDRVMPEFDVSERHHELVLAAADRTYLAARRLDLARSGITRALLAARGLPALVTRKARLRRTMTLDDLTDRGFVWLGEDPGVEFVLGIVGTFWSPRGGVRRVPADDFPSFDEPGVAKAAWNFRVIPDGDERSFLTTETRVRATDEASRRKFLLYWAAVGPFSGLIRKQALSLIKRDAQRT